MKISIAGSSTLSILRQPLVSLCWGIIALFVNYVLWHRRVYRSFIPSVRLLVVMLKKFPSFLYFIEARLIPCGSLPTDSSKSLMHFFCLYTLSNLKDSLKYPTHHFLSSPYTLRYITGWLYQVCFICFPV